MTLTVFSSVKRRDIAVQYVAMKGINIMTNESYCDNCIYAKDVDAFYCRICKNTIYRDKNGLAPRPLICTVKGYKEEKA